MPTIQYDQQSDAAYLRFSSEKVLESAEVSPGIVLDYDKDGHIVGMEILEARKNLPATVLGEAA
ncbi:MAG: DUF2283 domain-containing protein [Nitratireductor sp.]